MNLGQSIRHNTLWILSGNLATKVFGFIVGIILARLLVPEDFGMLVTITVFTGIAGFFAAGGMGQALIQAKEVDERHYRVVFTLQQAICVLIYLFFYLLAPYFSQWYDNPLYTDLMRVSALTFLLRPISNVNRSKLSRQMRFKPIAICQLMSMTIGSTSSILMALADMGPWALILGGMVGTTTNLLLLSAVTRWLPRFAFESNIARSLGGFGIKVSINDILVYARNQAPVFMISRFLGAAPVGLYNKAQSLAELPKDIVSGSAYQTLFRALSKEQDNHDLSRYLFSRAVTMVTIYTIPAYIGLWWLAESFIIFVYGENWADSIGPLKILSLTGIFVFINLPGAVIIAQDRVREEIWITLETLIWLAIGCYAVIDWGIYGVSWMLVAERAYTTLRLVNLANRSIGGHFRDQARALTPALLLGSIMFTILLAANSLGLHLLRGTSHALYLASMGSIGIVSYGLLFLYLPIPSIANEAMRWKRKLRLNPVAAIVNTGENNDLS